MHYGQTILIFYLQIDSNDLLDLFKIYSGYILFENVDMFLIHYYAGAVLDFIHVLNSSN